MNKYAPSKELGKDTYLPQVVPQETLSFSKEQRTFPTIFFPQAHDFVARNGHGGQRLGSS